MNKVGVKYAMKPSEYVRRNVRVPPFWHEDLPLMIERYGLKEVYCFSTDYPHLEGSKDPFGKFGKHLEKLPDSYRRQFFIENNELLLPNLASLRSAMLRKRAAQSEVETGLDWLRLAAIFSDVSRAPETGHSMPLPKDIRVIDTLLDLPREDRPLTERFSQLRDEGSVSGALKTPAGYMFKETPEARGPQSSDPVADTLREMDKHNIETAVFNLSSLACTETEMDGHQAPREALSPGAAGRPEPGMDAIRDITRAHAELGIVGVALFPVGYVPPVPINDKRMYPIYVKCIELDIAVFCTSGVPGPRLPFEAQYTGLVDEVCWFFPELRFVLRHGCEPWTDLAVKLLLKWPNLYYSTSAFAPKYYPKEIVEFANTRGADKIIYAGYYPLGLTLERIFRELEDVPFRDHVWPKFLRENAHQGAEALVDPDTIDVGQRGSRLRWPASLRASAVKSSCPTRFSLVVVHEVDDGVGALREQHPPARRPCACASAPRHRTPCRLR